MSTIPWEGWQFLIGEWVGEGGGEPGQGSAVFTFSPDLDNKVLVRRSHMDFPATPFRPAVVHDDLLIVYQDPDQSRRAIYFDNEGHVIHYSVEISEKQDTVTFLSEKLPSEPRFRLSYWKTPEATLTTRFEIAPPGQPEAFSVYVEGNARRK
jgi:hypothetical protein